MVPNVIIGGAQKAGTTSLFRYLASHPSVCASSIKEVDFFLNNFDKLGKECLKSYEKYYSHCLPSNSIRLEASPQYLMLSDRTAKNMHYLLPDIKLIFILREPVSVLNSYIKFKSGISSLNLKPESFISMARQFIDNPEGIIDATRENPIAKRLCTGCYINNLEDFESYYPKEQIGIFFYEELANDINSFVDKVCKFINIDASFFNGYEFRVENKTRSYKYAKLHLLAATLNLKLEPFFNKYPKIRNAIRSVYHSISVTHDVKQTLPASGLEQLNQFYEPFNNKLRSFLKTNYSQIKLPFWLDQ